MYATVYYFTVYKDTLNQQILIYYLNKCSCTLKEENFGILISRMTEITFFAGI